METIDNYLKYRKHKPEYAPWKQERDEKETKRLAYIKNNGIDAKQKENDIKRAKAVLNAVDIMDEYSQTRAEDMEMVIQSGATGVAQVSSYAGMGIGGLALLFSKKLKEATKNISLGGDIPGQFIVPMICSLITVTISTILYSQWGARKEIEASRLGRTEAMQQKLQNPAQFAVLTDEQEKERDEIAKNEQISEKESKKAVNANSGFGIIKSIKTLLGTNEKLEKAQKDFKEEIKNDEAKFDLKLTDEEIEEAKKDKQLITNIVEKIDIASQDYAENLELATSALTTMALAGGGLTGFITNKLLSLSKNLSKNKNIISVVVGLGITSLLSISATKIQKQGSRTARFKVKQDFMKNPEKLLYVDDEKAKNQDGTKFMQKEKRPGFFKFLLSIIKDNREYNKYLKEQNIQIQKQRKAQEKIKLAPEQEKRALQLQKNVFKMFNKLDEKSQTYSESTEAFGEILQAVGSLIFSGFMLLGMKKVMDPKHIEKIASKASNNAEGIIRATGKAILPALKYFITGIAPMILMNIFVTKEQKNASRVANMLAINEMDDYRNFVDYSGKTPSKVDAKEQKAIKADAKNDKDESFKGNSKNIYPDMSQFMKTSKG